MTLPEGKAGKALALGLCGILLLLAVRVIMTPLIGLYASMREDLSLLEAQKVRLTRVESELPALREKVATLRTQKKDTDDSLLLPDASDAVAAASLQTKVKTLGVSLGAEINSMESLTPQQQGGFRRVGVRVAIKGDLTALTGILTALSTMQPPLFVDNLEIRSGGLVVTREADKAAPTPMTIGLDIYGFRADSAQTADSRG